MNDLNYLYIELTHCFSKKDVNSLAKIERDKLLDDLRLKIFRYFDIIIETINDDNISFILAGLRNLGIYFEDLFNNTNDVNKNIIDTLLVLTFADVYCEYKYEIISTISKICEIFKKSEETNNISFEYLKKRIAFFLINYDFVKIKDLMDEGIFGYLDDNHLIKIYKNPKANFEKKLNIALYETEYRLISDAAEKLYTKLGEYGINPLLNWFSYEYNEGVNLHVCTFFNKMGSKIVEPYKAHIAKCLLKKKFRNMDILLDYKIIDLLNKNILKNIFWDTNTKYLEKIIEWGLETEFDYMSGNIIHLIQKIGGDAFKLLYKAFKLPFVFELMESVIEFIKKTKLDEIVNLKEAILFADEKNEMAPALIVILCDFVIKHISNEEKRELILDTNIIEFILEKNYYSQFNINPLELLNRYANKYLRKKIFNFFMKADIIAISRILTINDYYVLLNGKILTKDDWKLIIENPNNNFFETLTFTINYMKQNLSWGYSPYRWTSYIIDDFFKISLKNTIKNKIKESFKLKKIGAIFSIFELNFYDYFSQEEIITLVGNSIKVCIISQRRNYSQKLQNYIDEISK